MRRKSVTELYRDLEKAHEAYLAIPDAQASRQQRALEKASAIGRRVIETPTKRPEEMLLKIRLCLWLMGAAPYKKLEDLGTGGPDHDCTVRSSTIRSPHCVTISTA
jgi:hypothetical protein